jgi:predicted phosphoribosyltransferase
MNPVAGLCSCTHVTAACVQPSANWSESSRAGYVCLGCGAARVILAMPAAPGERVEMLRAECDELVCLATPEDFMAVGMHYEDFHQVDDNEVQELLQRAPTSV